MHRTIEASVPSASTDVISEKLKNNSNVMGLTVHKNASLKPPGDTLIIHVLNRGADDVLNIIQEHVPPNSISIVTSEVASINDSKNQKLIDNDIDEAIWEEMETGLRHNGGLTFNYLLLMCIGGIIAGVGLVSSLQHQIIAFVAASIIAPGMEPIAKIPLGIALNRWDVTWVGIKSSTVGYFVLALSAGLIFRLLLTLGEVDNSTFLDNEGTKGLLHFKLTNFIISLSAAMASILMYLAYRRNVIAGPLVALIMIPAAAAVGMSVAILKWDYVEKIGSMLAIEVALVIVMGLILVYGKQKTLHKRSPVR